MIKMYVQLTDDGDMILHAELGKKIRFPLTTEQKKILNNPNINNMEGVE